VVFPVHPRTRKCLLANGLWDRLPSNIRVIEPLSYLDMLRIMSSAEKIVTDSGGMQKEAYMLRVPCITVRDTTEWTETVDDGWNVLVGNDTSKLADEIASFNPTGARTNLYGEGDACSKIVKIIDGEIDNEKGSESRMIVRAQA
jgi:UDP-N-acetylglucosamine 2-epimerase (non-hydrolysing)